MRHYQLVQMYWNDYSQKQYVDAALYLTDAKVSVEVHEVLSLR